MVSMSNSRHYTPLVSAEATASLGMSINCGSSCLIFHCFHAGSGNVSPEKYRGNFRRSEHYKKYVCSICRVLYCTLSLRDGCCEPAAGLWLWFRIGKPFLLAGISFPEECHLYIIMSQKSSGKTAYSILLISGISSDFLYIPIKTGRIESIKS